MESNEEELLENVTDESGNSYMIQRMTVDNAQLLGTEILQTSNGLVVDLNGDFIPVNYTSEDLLSHDITEEDRNLAAALVAVQFSQQQKQQQTQQDGSVIINTSLPSLMTTLDGSKVRLGEQQVLVQDKQTGYIQIVDADDLYKQDFAKYDETSQTLQLIKADDHDAVIASDGDNREQKTSKKSLPHKKRISRRLKKNEKGVSVTKVQKCNFCDQLFRLDEIDNHQAVCQTNITSTITTANAFACQLCTASFPDQLSFFEHLKKHYEPVQEVDEHEHELEHEQEQLDENEMAHQEDIEEMVQEEEEEEEDDELSGHITILKSEGGDIMEHEGTIIKIESNAEDRQNTLLSSILQLTCLQCNKTFRRHKAYEAHVRDVHNKNDMDEFSEPEDLMAGIDVNPPGEIDDETKEWYRDDELHATEEDLKELEAKEHVCQNCNQLFPGRAVLIQHLLVCPNGDEPTTKIIKVKAEGRKARGKTKVEMECTLCDRKFAHRNSLVYHMRSHTEDRPYQCEQCGKSFFAASALKVHLRLHSGEKPYRCEYCGRNFRQWGDLKYHCISIHSDEKQYQCEYCGKEFARKYSLIVHRRIHTGEKNYRCEFCGKTFRASSYLQNHRRIHTGEKPHPCELCGKRFRVRSDMKRHLRTHAKRRNGRAVEPHVEELKMEEQEIVDTDLPQESEDTNESMTMTLKEENDTAVQSLQFDQDAGLESIRDANTLYVHMPILIS